MKFLLIMTARFGPSESEHRTAGAWAIGSQRPRIVHQRRNAIRCPDVVRLLAPQRNARSHWRKFESLPLSVLLGPRIAKRKFRLFLNDSLISSRRVDSQCVSTSELVGAASLLAREVEIGEPVQIAVLNKLSNF